MLLDKMALLYEKVVSTVTKPPDQRTDPEIEHILPWFRKKSELFKSQKAEIVKDILKNCQFMKCFRDHVIIKQGDKGDCFFIILGGSVAIHIQTNLPEDGILYESRSHDDEFLPRKHKELDRSIFGIMVGTIPAGRSFGELALINADCVRNASIIADEPTDLIVVNRDLYNRSLKTFQEKEFNERKTFVEEFPLFSGWPVKYKRQLAMSLRKTVITFDDVMVKQGAPIDGLRFLLSGQAKLIIDPQHHEVQYSDRFPLPDIQELEKIEARESIRKEMNMATPKVVEKQTIYARPRSATPNDRRKSHKTTEVCVMGAVEVIGDLELLFGLPSYSQTAVCTQEAELFILDQQNYDRLIGKRNPQTLDRMRDALQEKLTLRLSWIQSHELPLFRYFLYKLEERKRIEQNRLKDFNRKREITDFWRSGKLHSGPIIDQFGPGSVFYTIRMRAKVNQFKGQLRAKSNTGIGITRHAIGRSQNESPQSKGTEGQGSDQAENKENDDGADTSDDDFEMDFCDGGKMRKSKLVCDNAAKANSNARRNKSSIDCSVDEFMNHELNELLLTKLESRIDKWHQDINKIDTAEKPPKSANRQPVKLHRYVAEEHQKPFPGKKIFLKPKVRGKPSTLCLRLQTLEAKGKADPTPPTSAITSLETPRDMTSREREVTSRGTARDVWYENEAESDNCTEGQRLPAKRPHSSRCDRPPGAFINMHLRPRSARQYTMEDYANLKEALRKKQIAYKSLLMRPQTI